MEKYIRGVNAFGLDGSIHGRPLDVMWCKDGSGVFNDTTGKDKVQMCKRWTKMAEASVKVRLSMCFSKESV